MLNEIVHLFVRSPSVSSNRNPFASYALKQLRIAGEKLLAVALTITDEQLATVSLYDAIAQATNYKDIALHF